ncbi:MAG: hypothetical protein IPG02_12025 [Ignavibacteria bacterium]|nr:hypothetical protein [Ignavibacteria bacterium]
MNKDTDPTLKSRYLDIEYWFTATIDADGQHYPEDIAVCLRFEVDKC